MTILSYASRLLSNFLFMAMVYLTLKFIAQHQQRAIVAFVVLGYISMRVVSVWRSFRFHLRIEQLEIQARRHAALTRSFDVIEKQLVNEVSRLRRHDEVKSYIDLMFFCMIVLLCLAKVDSE